MSNSSFTRFSMSSTLGNVSTSSAGTKSDSLYSLTPMGLFMSFRAYSAVNLSLFLHSIIPMDGLSVSCFSLSSMADK